MHRVDGETLTCFVADHTELGGTVYTDDHGGYSRLAGLYHHETVRHSVSEYVNGQAHTNGVESFWSLLKRGYHGTYHKMSPKHLDRYVAEFAGRFNDRPLDTMDQMAAVARGLVGGRLRYRELTARVSERRAEHLLSEILISQGWKLRRPPNGDVLWQNEYRDYPHLVDALASASKSGDGYGLPEALIVDRESLEPLAVVEVKRSVEDLQSAVHEATEVYGSACIAAGYKTQAIALAGTSEESFDLRVLKSADGVWHPLTYDSRPISWIPNRADLARSSSVDSFELRPTIPPPEVLAARADEINRLLREAGIKDELRPAVLGAVMLALWSAKGDIRKAPQHILSDINDSCKRAFWKAGKPDLAASLGVDEANRQLAINARQVTMILERLNVTVLTAEHDYLGQLYETFFRYTGGNTIGQYFTPRHITAMMADLCEITPADVLYDPACGTGGFLIAAMDRIMREANLSRTDTVQFVSDRLIGHEKEPITASLCVANMILRGDGSTSVRRGDCFVESLGNLVPTVVLTNPPFPHKKTDVPPERFVERSLESLALRGRLAIILPTSLLVKASKSAWRRHVLTENSLVAVCQMPDELFQPFASSTTSVVLIEKGVPHDSRRKTEFVRIQRDGYALRKGTRVEAGHDEIPDAIYAVLNRSTRPRFAGGVRVQPGNEWAVGAYLPASNPTTEELAESVDVLLRRLASFYARYAPEIATQRTAAKSGELPVLEYPDIITSKRIANAAKLRSKPGTIGGAFHIFYGMKELHSREGIPPGQTLVISPTEQYNGCYGWLDFKPLIQPPFVTVAQTGSIGEAFVQLEPCAVNDDCLVLLPRARASFAELAIAAATLGLERWRFNYGRKLTPSRITDFRLDTSTEVLDTIQPAIANFVIVRDAALGGAPMTEKRKPGRPAKHDYDINKLQRTIPDTPENVAKTILSSPPPKKK